jgi:hypothetical protein
LIRSAEEPWIGALVAARSPNERMLKFFERISGM